MGKFKSAKRPAVPQSQQGLSRREAVHGLCVVTGAAGALCLNATSSGCKKEEPPTGPDMPLPPAPEPARDNLGSQARTRGLESLRAAIDFLWRQQADDGGIPSRVYEVLKSGQSTTPLVLLTLLQVPAEVVPIDEARANRAMDNLLRRLDRRGAIGFEREIPDYPCYATSMALSCAATMQRAQWKQNWAPAIAWLESQQFKAERGWDGHPALGGWGMGSEAPRVPPEPGHVDLSMTRRCLEALHSCGYERDSSAFLLARDFVLRCQGPRGGFIYSPVLARLNKGEKLDGTPMGYGSATTDGLLALLALGYPPNHPEVLRGVEVLRTMHQPHENPGIGRKIFQAFREALKGYYRAGASCVFHILGGPVGWRDAMVTAIADEQRSDGSWLNKNRLQNEDDPLVATTHSVLALSKALSGGGG